MGTPAITGDAAGISDPGKTKTAGVVDKLIAPDAAATADTIVHVPVRFVVPHPRNRKILDEDVADLVAEFKAGIPILNPLGVTAAADWNANRPADLKDIGPLEFIITAGGHRRLRAAELAGLKTVPCIVRSDFAGADGRKAALLENLHRQDLDPFEEAEAFAELVGDPYKLSQRDLAAIVGVNQSHISKRLKLLKLPTTVRESVRLGKFTLADAIEFARLADEPKLLSSAIEKAKQWRCEAKRAVDSIVEERDLEQKRQVEVDRLTGAGVKILDRAPGYHATASTRDPVRLDALGIKTVSHKKEPCHAAYVRVASWMPKPEVTYCCTEPKRHIGKKAESKVQAKVSTSSGSMSEQEKAAKRRKAELKKNVEPSRRAIVAQLVQSGFDTHTKRDIVTQSLVFIATGGYVNVDDDVIVDVLGIRPANTAAYLSEVIRAHAQAKADDVALAAAVAYFETRAADCSSQWSPWGDNVRWWLDTLAANGYVITDAEHEQLRDVRNDDGTWTPAESESGIHPDDGPTCRVCFAFLDNLPDGVTRVAEDLCSACSDAQDAGWVEPSSATPSESSTACLECNHEQPSDDCECPHCFCNPANITEPVEAVAG